MSAANVSHCEHMSDRQSVVQHGIESVQPDAQYSEAKSCQRIKVVENDTSWSLVFPLTLEQNSSADSRVGVSFMSVLSVADQAD